MREEGDEGRHSACVISPRDSRRSVYLSPRRTDRRSKVEGKMQGGRGERGTDLGGRDHWREARDLSENPGGEVGVSVVMSYRTRGGVEDGWKRVNEG